MRTRRIGALVVTLALALGATVATATAVGAQGNDNQFKDLKPVKAPKDCSDIPGVSDTEIKVGTLLPTSGPSAPSFASGLDGIKARIDKANADGELGKRKIVLEDADDGSDAARNLTAAQELVEQQDVFGIIENSPFGFTSAKYLNQQDVPVVGWHLGLKEFGQYPNMFGWRNSTTPDPSDVYVTRTADVMKELGAKKIALVSTNIANSATFINQIDDAIKKSKNGLEVVFKTTDVPQTQRDFTAEAQKIKESGADGLYTGMDTIANTALSEALKQAGVEMKAIIFPGGYDTRVLGLPGIDGAYFGIEFKPFELDPPAYTDYKAAMDEAGKFADGQVPYIGWLAADAFVEGIKAAGVKCPTREAFITNLRLEKDYDANGAFIPVDFSEIFGRPFWCTYYVQVQGEAFVPQFDGKPFCSKGVIQDGKLKKLTKAQQANG
ncbi:MAG: ABC transporter substrate-binding protein [Acidimicrobiia bacterium]